MLEALRETLEDFDFAASDIELVLREFRDRRPWVVSRSEGETPR